MSTSQRWTLAQANALFDKPFLDLLFEAQQMHCQHFTPGEVQVSTLLSIKTGACPEDCKYCPQSARYHTGLESERLMQAQRLAEAVLDFYNHNLDTSSEFYGSIVTTRSYQDRLDTLSKVRQAGIKVCSGGIVGLGEDIRDRAGLLVQLANLPTPPESVPINMLVKVKGTPLADNDDVDAFDFIRTIAVARIMMPCSHVRLSAGREQMNEQTQALCFMAGANSVFYGCKLLTTPNPEEDRDMALFRKLGINIERRAASEGDVEQQAQLTGQLLAADTPQYYNAAR
ncbi:biotin synthase BioB [Candidatus Sodalis pierantonius]|uniref:biotin synthase BioB n=1 Tax=Candidatus Sodalis pierantonii TaxID=1486991 RepID=UPI00046CBBEB|nr:biotin synthase BioB [Candidatus Sodalis pierantonius]